MGQRLFEDKITNLSESGGTITLAAGARLTIGGQQYITNSALNVAVDVTSANVRYQVFAVLSGGAVILVTSQNENSVGPVGEDAWKLVGSYYTDDSIAFGSFVNIKGRPVTSPIPYSLVLSGESVPPVRGGTVTEEARWYIDGEYMLIDWTYKHVTAGVQGTGGYIFKLPQSAGYIIDTSNIITLTDTNIIVPTTIGRGYVHLAASPLNTHVVVRNDVAPDELMMRVLPGTDAFWGSTVHQMGNVNLSAGFHARVPIQGLSNTPIEDL